MPSPLISVIIPSYNQGEYIENTILSVLRQEYSHWELLIQDGGSTDRTAEVVMPYVKADKRISFQSEKDKGFSDAVNKAIDRCSGDYGIIQNSDDFFSNPDVLSRAAALFSEHPGLHLLSASYSRVDDQLDELLIPQDTREPGFIEPAEMYNLGRTFGQSSTFFSLPRAREVGKLRGDVDMVADTDFWIRMSNYAPVGNGKIYYVNENWSCVTCHSEQRSADPSKFWIGRAQMFTNFVFDSRLAVSVEERRTVALVFVLDAFEYLNERKMSTAQPEAMYKAITGQAIPLKRQLKKQIIKIPGLKKLITRNMKPDGTDFYLSFPRGERIQWFKGS